MLQPGSSRDSGVPPFNPSRNAHGEIALANRLNLALQAPRASGEQIIPAILNLAPATAKA
jgi:hypothetical protein